jgi:hypothetical protein
LLPNSLIYLNFNSAYFSQSLDNLPNQLVHLIFGCDTNFKQKVNKLPDSIKEIKVFYESQIDLFPRKYKRYIKNKI